MWNSKVPFILNPRNITQYVRLFYVNQTKPPFKPDLNQKWAVLPAQRIRIFTPQVFITAGRGISSGKHRFGAFGMSAISVIKCYTWKAVTLSGATGQGEKREPNQREAYHCQQSVAPLVYAEIKG